MMAPARLPKVESEFASWYASLQIQPDAELRQKRWKGVLAATRAGKREDIETYVRLAFQTKHMPTPAQIDAMRQHFRGVDDTFPASGNDRELEILAAACLAQMMEAGPRPQSALAVTTTACAMGRRPALPMDVIGRAEAELLEISGITHNRPNLTQLLTAEAPTVSFSDAARQKIEATSDFPSVVLAFSEAETAVRKTLSEMAQKYFVLANGLQEYLRKTDEELQMLWWLIGRRSWDLDCAFEEVLLNAQPLVLAKELADHTEVLPGPPSINALLSRAGLTERKKVSITAAVNVVTDAWVGRILSEEKYSPVIMPIHFALQRRQETGTGPDWIANWASVTGIAAGHRMSCLMLGLLFYRERLLATFKW